MSNSRLLGDKEKEPKRTKRVIVIHKDEFLQSVHGSLDIFKSSANIALCRDIIKANILQLLCNLTCISPRLLLIGEV